MAKAKPADFKPVFSALKKLLTAHARAFRVARDEPGEYSLETKGATIRGKPFYMGGVAKRKNYVSYYLITLCLYPTLAKGISAALKRRRQGKSCFNFAQTDAVLFRELRALTDAGFKKFASAKHPMLD